MAIEVNILKQPKIEVKIKTLSSGGGSAEDYQNGYNAGYVAGESAGYENGYVEGKTDGITEGKQAEQEAILGGAW